MKKNELRAAQELISQLSGSQLTTFLLKIFSSRAKNIAPNHILQEWENSRFFKLPPENFERSKAVENIFSEIAKNQKYEQLEIPPVCPIGTVAALGPVHQNNVVSASRNCEVVSDSTNVLALEAASRRKPSSSKTSSVYTKLCCVHRLLRAQKFNIPNAYAHFKVFCMVTAGRDTGNFEFENQIFDHCGVYIKSLAKIDQSLNPVITIFVEDSFLRSQLEEKVEALGTTYNFEEKRPSGNGYYNRLSFHIDVTKNGRKINLVDGGMVDWTAKLLSNKKERLFISGIGLTRLAE
ncbi:MAG: hypothetical protein OXT65_11210 [Alphaproteobacteria bacterium]|nr:hypothetical protein [Alphaproteobacteria bacterium]